MTLMYNTIYDCIKMHVFYVNNIDLEEIFHCKIFTLFKYLFSFFSSMVLNLLGFSSLSARKKVKLIFI